MVNTADSLIMLLVAPIQILVAGFVWLGPVAWVLAVYLRPAWIVWVFGESHLPMKSFGMAHMQVSKSRKQRVLSGVIIASMLVSSCIFAWGGISQLYAPIGRWLESLIESSEWLYNWGIGAKTLESGKLVIALIVGATMLSASCSVAQARFDDSAEERESDRPGHPQE